MVSFLLSYIAFTHQLNGCHAVITFNGLRIMKKRICYLLLDSRTSFFIDVVSKPDIALYVLYFGYMVQDLLQCMLLLQVEMWTVA